MLAEIIELGEPIVNFRNLLLIGITFYYQICTSKSHINIHNRVITCYNLLCD